MATHTPCQFEVGKREEPRTNPLGTLSKNKQEPQENQEAEMANQGKIRQNDNENTTDQRTKENNKTENTYKEDHLEKGERDNKSLT